jgi:group I intron endonuclease
MEEYIMYIYKTTNIITNKIYIGQHMMKINENKKYFGSGKLLKRSIKKHGIKNFKTEILEYCKNIDELNEKEIFWITQLNSTNLNIGYNITGGGKQNIPTEEFVKRCKDARKNASEDFKKEWYAKISKTFIEKGISNGSNNPMYGKKYTKERQEKCAKSKKENKHKHKYYTEEYRKKQSKQTKGENNPNYNNNWSEEKKEKLSKYFIETEAHKGVKNSNFGKYGKDSSGYKKIPDNIRKDILYDYTNKFICIRKLSKKYNITERKVKEIIKDNNLEIKIIYFSKENQEKIKDMYLNKHMSFKDISKIIGVEYRNIKKLLSQIL